MRYIFVAAAALILTGCVKRNSVEFSGITPGIKSGVFIVKTTGDSTIYGENIKDGKFTVAKKQLRYPGYYLMNITDDANDDKHSPFEVYLEDGKYSIETESGKLFNYPKIQSPSKIQDQLSVFYTLSDKLGSEKQKTYNELNEEIKAKGNSLSPAAYTQLLNRSSAAEASLRSINLLALKQFVKQYPNSEISAHLMSKLNYEEDPKGYFELYNTFSNAAKNTDDGKEIGEKLQHLIKLTEGNTAPALVGRTSDGKAFDPKSLNKKIILIDFWRASNDFSRRYHQQIKDLLRQNKNLAVVSVSLDTRQNWWLDAIAQDNMDWTQISDLKGDDSPNATNWNITQLPTYYLLDGSWKIIRQNLSIGNIEFETRDYLSKAH